MSNGRRNTDLIVGFLKVFNLLNLTVFMGSRFSFFVLDLPTTVSCPRSLTIIAKHEKVNETRQSFVSFKPINNSGKISYFKVSVSLIKCI
ncbi:hypothetical protein BpHYR1_012606 [Brachionus plicatilis]|uniref:Uncharacterized protein n=1 Tax=Brachionus plicatilis TaxID=10195 RepID=A0A3M7Q6N9_BRAPC|nr:hypothetical protein BpHYR1_012606 [Brachionus plicatilis]